MEVDVMVVVDNNSELSDWKISRGVGKDGLVGNIKITLSNKWLDRNVNPLFIFFPLNDNLLFIDLF